MRVTYPSEDLQQAGYHLIRMRYRLLVLNRQLVDALYIATSEELPHFCERAKASHILAVDMEVSFARKPTFQALPGVGFTGSEIAAIDPLLIDDLTCLKSS